MRAQLLMSMSIILHSRLWCDQKKMKRSSQEIEQLVLAYQKGSREAALQLLDYYEPYFKKLLQVLTPVHTVIGEDGKKRKIRSVFQISDREQRNFVRCFVKYKETRKNVHMYAKSEFIRKVLYITVSDIRKRFALYEEDDIRNEINELFLWMAKRHHKPGFKSYIKNFFHLNLYKRLRKWNNDPYFDKRIPFDEEQIEVEEPDLFDSIEWDKPEIPYFIQTHEQTYYDENWINGYGCGEIFEKFTPFERRVLKLYYEWRTLKKEGLIKEDYDRRYRETRRYERDVAERLGYSRKTINVKRQGIKARLEKHARELHLLC